MSASNLQKVPRPMSSGWHVLSLPFLSSLCLFSASTPSIFPFDSLLHLIVASSPRESKTHAPLCSSFWPPHPIFSLSAFLGLVFSSVLVCLSHPLFRLSVPPTTIEA